MKTLKKTLCLVLALVMVLGLSVMVSADLDYEDNKDIEYKEAVDVMSGIGVLEGYKDGTFLPKQEVTREEAAKIIAYLMVGDAKEADALKTTADPFDDVAADRWSAGYIAYLASENVLNGKGDGKFDPTGKVTGLEFAKMLLTALGYGVNGEYVGANWSINVAKAALQYGIFDDNVAGANNEPATREECALYAFNTLGLAKVTYSALLGGYIENSMVWANNAESNKKETFANDFNLSATDADDDDPFYLMTGYYYYVGKTSNRISDYYGGEDYLVATYTTPVAKKQIYADLGATVVKNCIELDAYVDGCEISNSGDAADQLEEFWAEKKSDEIAQGTGYGVQTYVYAVPEYAYGEVEGYYVRICQINSYFGQVTSVKAETKNKDAYVNIKLACNEYGLPTSTTFETDEFAKYDYVLVNYSYETEKVEKVVLAETVDSKVKSYTNKNDVPQIGIGSETVYGAYEACVFDGQTSVYDMGKEFVNGEKYTLFFDTYGNLIGANDIAVVKNFAYVAQFGFKLDTSNGLKDELALTADIYTADGEHAVKFVKSDDFDAIAFASDEQAYVDGLNAHNIGLYAISESKGVVTLTGLEDYAEEMNNDTDFYGTAYGEDGQDPTKVFRGVSGLMQEVGDDEIDVYSNGLTNFWYVQGKYGKKGFAVDTYTGTSKAPTTTGDEQGVTEWYAEKAYGETKVFAEAVLVTGDFKEKKAEADDTVYFLNANDDWDGLFTKIDNEDGTWTVIYEVEKNGEPATIEVTYKDEATADKDIEDVIDNGYCWVYKDGDKLVRFVGEYSEKKSTKDKLTYVDNWVEEITGDTLYVEVFDADDEAHYFGVEITDETIIKDLSDNDLNTLEEMKDFLEEDENAYIGVCFAYNADLEVTIVYIYGAGIYY